MGKRSSQLAQLSPEKRALFEQRLLQRGAPADAGPPPIEARERTGLQPLSYAQELLYVMDQLLPGVAYNSPGARRLVGRLDIEALRQAFDALVIRHEALRARFVSVDGVPRQEVREPESVAVEHVELSHIGGEAQETALEEVLVDRSRRPFDLEHDPLLRVTLVRMGPDDHVLLVVIHHIASDGWSKGVLFRELGELYGAFREGRDNPLPPLEIQYLDYALWQREWLDGEVLERQLDFWRGALAGAPELLELPTDRPRPPVQTYRGERRSQFLSPSKLERLKELARDEGVTLFMLLLSVWGTLLGRYARQDDVVIGTPIAGRNRTELEALIGYFTNTLAIRCDLSGDPTFRELLQRVKQTAIGAYAHQDLPFERLVAELHPKRDLSRMPVFQVLFVLQNATRSQLDLPGLEGRALRLDPKWSKFDLTLGMGEHPQGLHGSWEYSTDLFEEETVARMMSAFEVLVDAVLADPGRRLSGIPLMGREARHELIVERNDTAAPFPERCVHELVADQARATPEAVAVDGAGHRLTFDELDSRSNQLAHYLRDAGVGPETLVGLCLERSPEMCVAILGVLKAGGAYMPLDPNYPPERLRLMLEDAEAPVVITEKGLRGVLPDTAATIVELDREARRISRQPRTAPAARSGPRDLFCVIYTSGSTGRPKGVMLEHRGVVNHALAMARSFGLDASDRVLQFSSLSFDISIEEMFPAWLSGAAVVLLDGSVPLSGPDFAEYLRDQDITVLDLPTAFWHEWVRDVSLLQSELPARLRLVVVGGERVRPDAYKTWRSVSRGRIRWLNTYAPTEATVVAVEHEGNEKDDGERELPLGTPIANARVYVLEDGGQPASVGMTGELHIGGVGVARGYWRRPELTEQRFLPDPFSEEAGARMYKTGDLARWGPDGELEFAGRSDDQVKIRGFRVEPGEVEAALRTHPGLSDVVVLAREYGPGDKRLVCYFVTSQPAPPDVVDLRAHLASRLPPHMMPSAYVPVSSFPLTPNGKLDVAALPVPGGEAPSAHEYVAPRDEVETKLAEIWREVLGVEHVGVLDDFFDLGGHSLLAMRLFARIDQVFDRRLPLATLFEAPALGDLAACVRGDGPAGDHRPIVQLQQGAPGRPALFLAADFQGEIPVWYRLLVRHLDDDQPVYALRSQGLEGDDRPPQRSIEEMAIAHVRDVRGIQREGPYLVAGHCFSANLGFQMAWQLRAEGQDVGLLAVVDAVPYGHRAPLRGLVDVRAHARAIFGQDARERSEYVRDRLTRLRVRVGRWLGKSTGSRRLGRLASPSVSHLRGVPAANMEAARAYVCPEYDGKVSVVTVNKARTGRERWGAVARGGAEMHVLAGEGLDHVSLLREPHVRLLAELLQAEIDRAARVAAKAVA